MVTCKRKEVAYCAFTTKQIFLRRSASPEFARTNRQTLTLLAGVICASWITQINSHVEEGLLVNAKVSFRQFILNHGRDNHYETFLSLGSTRDVGEPNAVA